MKKSYLHLFLVFFLMLSATGCREDELLMSDDVVRVKDLPVEFNVDIADDGDTRGIVSASKKYFSGTNDQIHIRVDFLRRKRKVDNPDEWEYYNTIDYVRIQAKYTNSSSNTIYNEQWNAASGSHALVWPNDAVSASFDAYYLGRGIDGYFTTDLEDTNEHGLVPKHLSAYVASDVPMHAAVDNVRYGEAVRLEMTRMFSFFTLTDIQDCVSTKDMWFSLPEGDMRNNLNNAFTIEFNKNTKKITPKFVRKPYNDNFTDAKNPDTYEDYPDKQKLIYIKSYDPGVTSTDKSAQGLCFFLEPGVYTKFCLLYQRTRDTYNTYLAYEGSLQRVLQEQDKTNTEGAFKPNGRYVFSVLRSLGMEVEQKPDNGWDESEPTAILDVESFLRAMEAGKKYEEQDPNYPDDETKKVTFLETDGNGGTILVRNVSFRHFYYEDFSSWWPTLANNFNGDYHYIYDLACPFIHDNKGTIKNVGFRNIKTGVTELDAMDYPNPKPGVQLNPHILSQEPATRPDNIEMSYNGIIARRNMPNGKVENVRVEDADITVQIDTNNDTQEAHIAGLLFGENQGRISDIGLAGKLNLTVENAKGETIIPRVYIGGLIGQNSNGTISGISYIENDKPDKHDFEIPKILLTNKCQGDNGVYWMGGIIGNNNYKLEGVYLTSVKVDATGSRGLGSYIGGVFGASNANNANVPELADCMVGGEVKAGPIGTASNVDSFSYSGGVCGMWNVQTNITNCSVQVDVFDTSTVDAESEYAQGGVFGIVKPLPNSYVTEGSINGFRCFSTNLKGNSANIGNFAGIVPTGYGEAYWRQFEANDMQIKEHSTVTKYIGLEKQVDIDDDENKN